MQANTMTASLAPNPGRRSRSCRPAAPTVELLEQRQFLSAAPDLFTQTNLVANVGSVAGATTDPNLVHPWGIAINPANGAIWVSDNGSGLSTAYTDHGANTGPIVAIPPPTGASVGSAPTGIVFNNTSSFVVHNQTTSGASAYVFATEIGTISGWAPSVDLNNAILAVDNHTSGAVYKGLAMAQRGSASFLYAADFHNGRIDVFDSSFHPVTIAHAFHDPSLPAGFAPFNVANIGGSLYVTYAKQDAVKHDDIPGAGLGYVDVYNSDGKLVKRFASKGSLDAPWAVVRAPAGFGPFGGDILVGNFGDGRINVFSTNGLFVATLKKTGGQPIAIGGLWGLQFGNGTTAGKKTTLFFAAGPNGALKGLLGKLDPKPATSPSPSPSPGPYGWNY
ncbi:MAG: TIGR03118 family protein [Tepidisphaerales bacterium]